MQGYENLLKSKIERLNGDIERLNERFANDLLSSHAYSELIHEARTRLNVYQNCLNAYEWYTREMEVSL